MTIHINIGEAKTQLSKLVAAALAGEDVVLQKAGVPQARIVPLTEAEAARREAIAAKRKAAFGIWADKYRHLHGTDALDVPSSMTDEEVEERFQRKFGGAPS
jgi:antitoxin (DNA-binding transcriptional repressor) of toxin-antitoxin stability system